MTHTEIAALGDHYRRHLERVILPFWLEDCVDDERGGIFTCVANATRTRVADHKYVWSQGRWAWTMAHAARMAERGLLGGDPERYRARAVATAAFLHRHALLADGSCAYLLDADGTPLEHANGSGYATSIFADCFVALGWAGVARVTGDATWLDRAALLTDRIDARIAAGMPKMEPYPVPEGYRTQALPMIQLHVTQELERAGRALADPRTDAWARAALAHADTILGFVQPNGLLREIEPVTGPERLLTRHVTPGHAIESMWFVLEQALTHRRADAVERALQVIDASLHVGWDTLHGGLLRFLGSDGRPPRGPADGAFEQLILDTWDAKIWWPHSEALYATLLAFMVGGDERFARWHDRLHRYVLTTFPNPDASVGEWIQIRDRHGRPLDRVVALPVKDPYHVTRNLLLLIELCGEGIDSRTVRA